MIAIAIGIISLIILLVFFVILLLLSKRQNITLTTIDDNGKIKDEKGLIENEVENANKKNGKIKMANFNSNIGDGVANLKQATANKIKSSKSAVTNVKAKEEQGVPREDVFRFMEFDRILDDMIVQKNGSRFTKALKCKGINYDLMSEAEQLAVEEGFITFLNTLKYPIQLYVQAQNINLKDTINKYKENVVDIEQEYNNINAEYNKIASAFDVDEIQLAKVTKERDSITNVYEYSKDIIKYVEKMSNNKRLLERNFYVLVSYNTSEITSAEKFNKDELIEMCSTELTTRCQAIVSALTSCSVASNILNGNELAELLYTAYNRDDVGLMSVKDNMESGFFRLYSTSEDAFEKKQEQLEEYIRDSARVRALEAIKYAIENNEISTPAMEQLQEEEEISRTATQMVNAENFDKDFKDKVNKKILQDFRDTKKELLEEDAEQKKIIKEQSKDDMEELERLKSKEKPDIIKKIDKINNSTPFEDEKKQDDNGNVETENKEGDNNESESLYGSDSEENDSIV